MEKVKDIIKISFLQLLIVYTLLVFLSSITAFSKFTMHFEVLALILAIFAIVGIKEEIQTPISTYWLIPAFIFIFIIRILPYINNAVPLGYDPGLYHYLIQHPGAQDNWVAGGWEPGLFIITSALKTLGISANTILTYGLIFFELLLGVAVYFAAKKYFNKNVGVIAVLLYATSATQFLAFTLNYFKQILGLILLLWSFYLMKDPLTKTQHLLLILTASFLGAVHRPTFLIFGLVFLVNTLYNSRNKIDFKSIFIGCSILLVTLMFYIGRIKIIILPWLVPITTANIFSGTFIDIIKYQLLCLAYLPFAFIGFFFLIKKKDFNVIWIYFLINGIIVLLKLIFYNRYIISLDIAMIIMAAYGLSLLAEKKKLGAAITIILIISSGYIALDNALRAKPLIDKDELAIIQSLPIEQDAFIMATASYYSPWMLYSERKVIAPGMFDYNKWNRNEWEQFWKNTNVTELMNRYTPPIYVFAGRRQRMNYDVFNNECFELKLNESRTFLYKWSCQEYGRQGIESNGSQE